MREFIILTDSTSDLTKQLREQYNVDYVPMNYVIDGQEYKASLDWESHSVKDFYDFSVFFCHNRSPKKNP